MTTTNAIAPSPDLTVLESPSAACPASAVTENQPAANQLHRKIAKLPRPLRDLINSMMDDNLPAGQISAKLQASTDPPLPYPISEMNISDWKKTGYQRHLAQQERLSFVQANREAALDMVAGGDTTTLPEATLQIIASQFYDLMGDFSPLALKEKLAEDPLKYTRFLNVFARLTREIVVLKKHRDACSKTAAAEPKELDTDRDLSDSEHQLIVKKMDKVFKIRRRPPGGAAGPPPGYAFFSQLQASKLKAQGSAPGTDAVPAPAPVGPLPPACDELPQSAGREPSSLSPSGSPRPFGMGEGSGERASESGKDAVQTPGCPSPVLFHSRVPNSAEIETQTSKLKIPVESPQSKIEIQNSKMEEHCLECGTLLPALLANGDRPQELCENCGEMLRRPGIYWKPSLDRCPNCNAALPHPLPSGERYSQHCLKCGTFLPPYEPPSTPAPEPPTAAQSKIEIQNSKILEKCHYCRIELPPLQSDGQRPFTHCQKCATALRPPETLHLYCPSCAADLRALIAGDHRTSSTCPWCAAALPPWPEPPESAPP